MPEPLPIRTSPDERLATWNPALTRASQVIAHVLTPEGEIQERRAVNSGRVKVRTGERVVRVVPATE